MPFAAGGLYSAAEDLYLWAKALADGRLLSKESLDAMHTPFKNRYGYGVFIGGQYGLKNITHGGGIEGAPPSCRGSLIGSFNDWKPSTIMCGREGAEWVCRIDLKPGKYLYKFIVDGDWITDPGNPRTEGDESGNNNSVMLVP